ncbi:hypothetical protein BC830DRAFT_1176591 [Chytriomyces sp. MP71]|nr:hypothetical protein BC830DRAFT_1176591 [Chytriomyces sp. MP71]
MNAFKAVKSVEAHRKKLEIRGSATTVASKIASTADYKTKKEELSNNHISHSSNSIGNVKISTTSGATSVTVETNADDGSSYIEETRISAINVIHQYVSIYDGVLPSDYVRSNYRLSSWGSVNPQSKRVAVLHKVVASALLAKLDPENVIKPHRQEFNLGTWKYGSTITISSSGSNERTSGETTMTPHGSDATLYGRYSYDVVDLVETSISTASMDILYEYGQIICKCKKDLRSMKMYVWRYGSDKTSYVRIDDAGTLSVSSCDMIFECFFNLRTLLLVIMDTPSVALRFLSTLSLTRI